MKRDHRGIRAFLALTVAAAASALPAGSAAAAVPASITVGMADPFGASNLPYVSRSASTQAVYRDQFATLLRIGANLAPEPYLVSKWWYADGGTRLYMELAKNAAWSNGTPVTSADVALAVDYLASPEYNNVLQGDEGYRVQPIVGSGAERSGLAQSVSGFHAVNGREFYFQLRSADASALVSDLAGLAPLPSRILGGTPFSQWPQDPFFQTFPVGSGPFLVSSWTSSQATLRANPRFVLGVPRSSSMAIQIVPESAAAGLLAAGEIDLYAGLPATAAGTVAKIPGCRVAAYPGNHYTFLGWTDNVAPFSNAVFRQAVEYALNRPAMIQAALPGGGTLENGPLPPDSQWYDQALSGAYPYNPATARSLLVKAGFHIGGNAWLAQPNGSPIALTIAYAENDPSGQIAAQAAAADLQALYIDAQAKAFSVRRIVEGLTTHNAPFQGFIMGWRLSPDPNPAEVWQSGALFNVSTFDWSQSSDPNVALNDQYIARQLDANSEVPSHRKQILDAWQALISSRMPVNFLYDANELAAVSTRLQGVRWSGAEGAIDPWLWSLAPAAGAGSQPGAGG